jgi:alpha-N-arabinofuranosidase
MQKKLNINFASPDYVNDDKKIPALNISASQDSAGVTHISLVNLDPNKKISLQTSLVGINWKTVTGQILTAAKLTDVNTFENPYNIKITSFTGAKKSGDQLMVDLPAKSVVILELK